MNRKWTIAAAGGLLWLTGCTSANELAPDIAALAQDFARQVVAALAL